MDWIAILGPIINGLLAKLFQRCKGVQPKESPQAFLRRTQDARSGTWPASIMAPVVREVAKADRMARKAQKKLPKSQRVVAEKLSKIATRQIAHDRLIEASLASPQDISAAFAIAEHLPEEES